MPIVSVAGTDGKSFCWGDDVAGMLSDGWFDFSVGFICVFSGVSVWFRGRSAAGPEFCLVDRRR